MNPNANNDFEIIYGITHGEKIPQEFRETKRVLNLGDIMYRSEVTLILDCY